MVYNKKIELDLWYESSQQDNPLAFRKAANSFSAKLAKLEGLKTFPAVAQKVLSIFSDPNYKIREVVTIIEDDPALATSVLKLANSPLFVPVNPIGDIHQAIVRLGASEVRDVVLGVATMSLFSNSDKIGIMVRDHCAGVAATIKFLANKVAIKNSGWLFLAGLLHDIGKLLLLESLEMDYNLIGYEELKQPFNIHKKERIRLGYDHAVLAAHVVLAWNFDRSIAKLIAWHHAPNKAKHDSKMAQAVALLRVADFTAYQLDKNIKPDAEQCISLFFPVEDDLKYLNIKKEFLAKWWGDLEFNYQGMLSVFN